MSQATLRIADETARALSKRVPFTVESLGRLTCPAGKNRVWVYDTKSPLAMMITGAGSKAFYVYRKVQGRPQRVRLGGFPEITVDQARKLAQVTLGDIAKGVNPMEVKRQARAKGMNFGELFAWYLERHAKARKRSWRDDEVRYEKHLKGWASRRLEDIQRVDVLNLHQRVADETSPTTANRVLSLISVMFNKAALLNWEGNPAKGIEHFPEKSRERFLTAEEMPRFLAAIKAEPKQDWQDFFQLCLFAGARSGNVKAMRWDELDLETGTWRVPEEKAKGKETLLVHLTADVVKLLKARQQWFIDKAKEDHPEREKPPICPWVFPSHGKTGHIEEPKKAWAALLKRAKIEELWIHDLRRSLGSWAAAGGASLHIIGKALGHKDQRTTAIYARLQLDAVRSSVDAAAAAMTKAGKKKRIHKTSP